MKKFQSKKSWNLKQFKYEKSSNIKNSNPGKVQIRKKVIFDKSSNRQKYGKTSNMKAEMRKNFKLESSNFQEVQIREKLKLEKIKSWKNLNLNNDFKKKVGKSD